MGRDNRVISLFSGAMGLDLGLEHAGFEIAVTVECNRYAAETIRKNRPDIALIEKRIEEVSTRELLKSAGLRRGEAAILTGGPSCQAFSTAGNRLSVRDPRGAMFKEFLRVVREARPRFFVMENVRGILSAAVRHRPLDKRGPGHPRLRPEEELGSALRMILKALKSTGYHVGFYVMNAADFGVPQVRERVVFVGSRDGHPLGLPVPTHSRSGQGGLPKWRTLRQALRRLVDDDPQYPKLSAAKKRYLRRIPEGGNWRDLPRWSRKRALGAAYASWGGRVGFYRRLAWSRPSPALTTRPDCRATMFCHPTRLRPLSVRECARIQEFPDGWTFDGPRAHHYTQIGNAVPVGLGAAIGKLIRTARRRRRRPELLGQILCVDPTLLAQLERRPRTVLNPKRMRRYPTVTAARRWLPRARTRNFARLLTLAEVAKSARRGGVRETARAARAGSPSRERAARFVTA